MPTAVVTGASRGIGKAIAVHLASVGFDVALVTRTLQEGEQQSGEHYGTRSLLVTAERVLSSGARIQGPTEPAGNRGWGLG